MSSKRKIRKANKELFGRLAGSFRGPGDLSTNPRYLDEAILADSTPGKAVTAVIKRTVKDYRKTLRKLASGPRRTKKV